jgi:hypothetical protein
MGHGGYDPAWEDKFKRLLMRFERISRHHFGLKLLAYTMIHLRHFCSCKALRHACEVNWHPWSELIMSGIPWLSIAFSNVLIQDSVSRLQQTTSKCML